MREGRAPVGPVAAAFVSSLLLAYGACGAGSADAQTEPSLDTRTWRPPIDPEGSMVLEPPSTPGPWRWNLAAWAQYAQEPVVVSPPYAFPRSAPVEHFVGADLVASVGIGQRFAIGLDVPVFWQNGATGLPVALVGGPAPTFGIGSNSGAATTAGIGDLSVRGKVTVISDDRMGTHIGFGLALLPEASVPTGDKASFMGDGDERWSLTLLAGYTLGPIALRASAGFASRSAPHVWPAPQGDGQCGLPCDQTGGPTYGASAPWAVGLTLRPKAVLPSLDSDDRQTWEIAAHGSVPAGPVTPFVGSGASLLSPSLLALDDRIALGHYRDTYVVVGGELGLDQATGTPVARGVLAVGWAPRSHDKDADGVDDDADECPELPEDRDGIQDGDGCPEDDADDDGIPDAQDACPLVKGVPSPVAARNGCPEGGAK